MKRFLERVWMVTAPLALISLASIGNESRAGTIPAGTYTTPMGFVNSKSLTVTTSDTVSGTGTFPTLAATDVSFTVATGPPNNVTTYAFSEQILNPVKGAHVWMDFEMTLGGNVGATFQGKGFSNRFSNATTSNGATMLTFTGGTVGFGQTVTFSFSVNVPNPKPNTTGVLILTEHATVPEPCAWILCSIGMIATSAGSLWRKRQTVDSGARQACRLAGGGRQA
jgi:hypothetical protein